MADEIARRRELRRKRILENAEERKRKIFGTSLPNNDDTPNGEATEPKSEPPLENAPEETHPTINHNNNPTEGKQSDIFRPPTNDFETLSTLLSNPSLDQHTPRFSSSPLESNSKLTACFMSPVPVALLVCFVLYMDMRYVISNSLALPFVLWEVHKIWLKSFKIENASPSFSFLGIALMLCGLQQSAISTYYHMFSIFSCIVEDFALYLFIVVSFFAIVGF